MAVFAVVLTAAAGLAFVPQGAAYASPAGANTSAGGFWATMTPGETFTQAASQAAQASRSQVVAVLNQMLHRQEAGQGVYIPESKNGALVHVKASHSDLTGALAAVTKTATTNAATNAAVAGTASTAVAPAASAPQSSWPVRGNACGNNRAWCNLRYEIDAVYCSQSCIVEDKLTARLTVNPSASGVNRVNWNVLYSPDYGNFDGYHFQWFFLKFASQTECGTGNTGTWSTSTSNHFDTYCNTTLYNSRNTTAVKFWAHLKPANQYYGDQAKDGTAVCQPKSSGNTYCLY